MNTTAKFLKIFGLLIGVGGAIGSLATGSISRSGEYGTDFNWLLTIIVLVASVVPALLTYGFGELIDLVADIKNQIFPELETENTDLPEEERAEESN